MSRNYPIIALNAAAFATEVTAVASAYPAAANLFGPIPAAIAMTATAITVYAGWYIAANHTDTEKRIIGAVVATLFSVATVVGIHSTSKLATSTAATAAATTADNLYESQEQQRIASLTAAEKERAATSKQKEPERWDSLNAQVTNLQTPTKRQASASQITQGMEEPSSAYAWGIASAFSILSPALLLLAWLFATRQQPANNLSTQQNQQHKQIELTPTNDPPTAFISGNNNPSTTDGDPLAALLDRMIAPTDDGNITAAAVSEQTGCTDRQARNAIRDAWHAGALEKDGAGNATRYRYAKQPTKLRSVK